VPVFWVMTLRPRPGPGPRSARRWQERRARWRDRRGHVPLHAGVGHRVQPRRL